MNSVDSAYHSQSQSASTPSSGTPDPKTIAERFSGEKVKMSNSTPNGYSNVSSFKVKSDEHSRKHHDLNKSSDHKHSNSSHHNSDHTKRKDGDSSKLSSSSKPKDGSNKLNKSSHDVQKSKEHHDKKHEHSKSSSDKLKKEKSSNDKSSHDGLKKIDKHRDDKHREKSKDGHSSEHKHKDKTKEHDRTKDDKSKDPSKVKKIDGHKDKPKDKSEKPIDKGDKPKEKSDKPKEKSDRPKEKSGDRPKEKSDKPKDKIDKPKDKGDKPKEKEKPRDKSDKPKDKSDKPKEKSHDKLKDKSKENLDKSKDRISDKSKDKAVDNLKDKKRESLPEKKRDSSPEKKRDSSPEKRRDSSPEKKRDSLPEKKRESSPEKKIVSPQKDHSKKILETPKFKPQPTSPVKSPEKSDLSSPLSSPNRIKEEIFSDDDVPLSTRKPREASKPIKREILDEESDDEPLSARISKVKKVKIEKSATKKRKADTEDDDYEEYDSDYKKPKKKAKKETKPAAKKAPIKKEVASSPKKGRAKKEDDKDVWKWWEEEKHEDGIKWRTLDHKGPVFAPPYERVPKNVKFYYDGKHMELSEVTEEVAGFYGRMLDHDYTAKESFNTNFFKDWRKVMTPQEKETIKDLKKCNFKDFDIYYKQKSEERKSMTKEQKQEIKKENAEMVEEYGFCIIDGHRQKIGNFKIEPPGLFRGRGEHPKMGMLKRRVQAEDILINIGRESKVPDPPPGHKWKEIRHDNTVTWLASWNENILNSTKYIMLNPSSKLKGEKDWQKYETARKLKNHAERIRNTYEKDFKSKEMKVRQRAVALYFIDKLALRAGNEKDEDTADTVGCCSLRVEHITLDEEKDGQEYVVSFDFLGKDSIRYENSVAVEKRAFKNLKLFMENKQPGDDLFDRLNTSILNKYLTELMDGLTAKVFRTYNASKTLQEQLDLLTKEEMSIPEKLLAYNRANRSVAVLCNHQRAIPKTFDKSMENLKNKIDEKLQQIKTVKKELKQLKSDAKNSGSERDKQLAEKKKKRLQQLEEQLQKLEVQATDKEENKQIALGTSKLNYLDPRISVAWCKKWDVPIEKIYNRTQRDKFRWAIEMAGPEFKF